MTPIQLNSQTYYDSAHQSLTQDNPTVNQFALAGLDKICINVGVGKYEPKEKNDIAIYLQKLTGQKPKQVASRVSIAGFKLRKGEIVGLTVTLRGKRMYDFLLHLVYIALPRSRDFKGVKQQAFDKHQVCYSLGIENSSIFPTVGFDSSVSFGMQINLVFKSGSDLNRDLLTKLQFPFSKSTK